MEIECRLHSANYSLTEIFIYTLKKGRVTLVAELDDDDMRRDYNRYYSNGTLWSGNGVVKVRNGHIIVDRLAEGSHAAPKYGVTLNYKLSGGSFVLSGKPVREKTGF